MDKETEKKIEVFERWIETIVRDVTVNSCNTAVERINAKDELMHLLEDK